MKTSYYKKLSPVKLAVLDLTPSVGIDNINPNGFFISRVNTPPGHRRKGHARELMRECLADADAEAITLYLHINDYGDMNKEQLTGWYKRCGFTVQKDGLFVREPRPIVPREFCNCCHTYPADDGCGGFYCLCDVGGCEDCNNRPSLWSENALPSGHPDKHPTVVPRRG